MSHGKLLLTTALLYAALLAAGCDYSDDRTLTIPAAPQPPVSSAKVVPGVNPAFTAVSEVATSVSASGPYAAVSDASYDAATETVTLGGGSVTATGNYVRITGTATIGSVSSSYTVFTYVASNSTSVAANELTSLAVAHVASGTSANFNAAVDKVAADTVGVDSADISSPRTQAQRSAAMQASMAAISNQFANGNFVPGTTDAAAVNAAIWQCVELGGLVWDNMSHVDAGGTGSLPTGETSSDYIRCKACHGWDQRATDGGYARRSRTSSRPNAGYMDPNTVSRNISGRSISLDMVLHAGTGRAFAEGSAVFDSTDPWGPGAQKGNEHPDLSSVGVNAASAPSADQMRCVTAFLNHPDAGIGKVFAAIDPNSVAGAEVPEWCISSQCAQYTLVGTADALRGNSWYHNPNGGNCVTCHGEPEDPTGPLADGPEGGLLNFLRQDGKHSEFAHKVRWGQAGDALMTRANMNNPSAGNIADALAYLDSRIQAAIDVEPVEIGALAFDDMSRVDAGGTGVLPGAEPNSDYQRCKACHGWDRLGTDGGYARRSRTNSRPNAGYKDPNTVSRNIDSLVVSADMLLHAGTGRGWAEGSAIFDGTDPWGPGTQKGNEHPDLSPGGVNGTEVPTQAQIDGLVEFLNFPGGRADAVFSAIVPNPDPVPIWCVSSQCTDYTIVATADPVRGEAWYHDPDGGNCVTCHGEPEDEVGPLTDGPEGGLLHFLRQDGKHSEFRHKVQWGQAGDALMTRQNMNDPTATDIADVLAYLHDRIVTDAMRESIEIGGLAYDNMSRIDAGGTGVLPVGEPNSDYQRCKACHGWDRLGTDGGYARRSRTSSRPNAGYQDPNSVSRNIDSLEVTEAMLLHAGIGRSWAEGTAVFDGTAPWGPGTQKGNEHPDLSMGGVNGTDVPTAKQIRGLVDFLNYPDGRADAVFAAIEPNPDPVPGWCIQAQCADYTLVASADAARGELWYHDSEGGNCVTCHGEPEDAVGPLTDGPEGGILNFLRQDGKHSEYRHKVQWGQAGDELMTRENMHEPTAADIADSLAYLNERIDDFVAGRPFANNDSASTDQGSPVDIDVLANDSHPTSAPITVTAFDATSAMGGTVSCTTAGICTYSAAAGFSGVDHFDYTISDGSDTDSATVTVTVNATGGGGPSVTAGMARYDADCSVCHAAGSHDTSTALGGNDMGGRGTQLVNDGLLISDLVTIDPIMVDIVLTNQEILDIAAFLDSVP